MIELKEIASELNALAWKRKVDLAEWGNDTVEIRKPDRYLTPAETCAKTGHIGGDGDGRCDRCNEKLF